MQLPCGDFFLLYMPMNSYLRLSLILLIIICPGGPFVLSGCTNRPLVKGLLREGGTIYRETEQEEWGARSTLKIRGLDF